MKKIICLLLPVLFLGIVNAQQQNIELPDFVITGRQSMDVKAAQKPKPELISILSTEFFTPQYSPEELPVLISSDPISIQPGIKTSEENFSGKLKVMVGKYSLPVGELDISQSYENYLFDAKLWGSKITEYIPNAGYNTSGFSMTHNFFLSTKSDFLPGTKISIDAGYWRDSYNFYGSNNPERMRESNNGNLNFNFENNYNRFFSFSFGLGGDILSLNESDFRETNIDANGLLELKLDQFTLGINARYKIQQLNNSGLQDGNYNFLSTEAYVKVMPVNSLSLKAGASYSVNDGNDFISPFAVAEYQIEKGITLGAEFKPYVTFKTNRNFISENLYTEVGNMPNSFTKFKNNITGSLSYEFQRSFLINVFLSYARADNYIYYENNIPGLRSGNFYVQAANDIDILKGGLTVFYHPGVFGSFYVDAVFQGTKYQNGLFVPYQPRFKSTLSYSYDFSFGLALSLRYNTAFGVYSDQLNINQLADYHNISGSVSFELLKGIKITGDFQNILNRSNFVWELYQQKPFDYLVGIEYRW